MAKATVPKHPQQFFEDAPILFLRDLHADSEETNAPNSIKQDWHTVSKWLGQSDSNFSDMNKSKIRQAWKAYVAIGVAPSVNMQHIFESFSKTLPEGNRLQRPPKDVLDVFDRLLATDGEILEKRQCDVAAETLRMQAIFKSKTRQSWWRSQSPIFRNWAFGSIVWMILFLIYGTFFDPFDNGGWGMNDDELTQFLFILFAPVGVGLIYYTYQKWVR